MGWSKRCYTAVTTGNRMSNDGDQAACKAEVRRRDQNREDAAHDRTVVRVRETVAGLKFTTE